MITDGIYSDYSVCALMKALKDIDVSLMATELTKNKKYTNVSDNEAIMYLVQHELAKQIPYTELHCEFDLTN